MAANEQMELLHEVLVERALSSASIRKPIRWNTLSVEQCLQASRALCFTAEDVHSCESWDELDVSHTVNLRNEAAARAKLVSAFAGSADSADERYVQLRELCSERPVCAPVGCEEATAGAASQSTEMTRFLRWCVEQGIVSRLEPAEFSGGLRGVRARDCVAAGEVVLEVPLSALVTYDTARDSALGQCLVRLPGLGEESLALVFTMLDRHDEDSPHAPFWNVLPKHFGTGLSAADDDVELLNGTPLYDECRSARQHMQDQFRALQPVLQTLQTLYGADTPAAYFSYHSFLWAAEVWYAYAIQVQFPDGEVRPCLAPLLCLANHSCWPHVVHYSAAHAASNSLRIAPFRAVEAGQQLCLSYGPLPNSHLLLFYGFTLEDNAADYVEVPAPAAARSVGARACGLFGPAVLRLSRRVPHPWLHSVEKGWGQATRTRQDTDLMLQMQESMQAQFCIFDSAIKKLQLQRIDASHPEFLGFVFLYVRGARDLLQQHLHHIQGLLAGQTMEKSATQQLCQLG